MARNGAEIPDDDRRRRSCYLEDETALLFDSSSRRMGVSAAAEDMARRYGVCLQRIAGKLLALYVLSARRVRVRLLALAVSFSRNQAFVLRCE